MPVVFGILAQLDVAAQVESSTIENTTIIPLRSMNYLLHSTSDVLQKL
jgi:hypothetical protein